MENKTLDVVSKKAARVSETFGHGILAGLIGTAAMTAVQMVEMKFSNRGASSAPVIAAGKVMGFKPDCGENNEEICPNKEKLNNFVHVGYGTFWGEARALISSFGVKGWKASLLHFSIVWGTSLVMLPALKVSPTVTKWGAKAIVKDAFLHLAYAFSVGFVFDKVHKHSC